MAALLIHDSPSAGKVPHGTEERRAMDEKQSKHGQKTKEKTPAMTHYMEWHSSPLCSEANQARTSV
jgi:hypothetical protein